MINVNSFLTVWILPFKGFYFKTNKILLFNKVKEHPFCSFICVSNRSLLEYSLEEIIPATVLYCYIGDLQGFWRP